MTSFELFRLLKFLKNLHYIYIFILFSPESIMGEELHHFMKKIHVLHQIMV